MDELTSLKETVDRLFEDQDTYSQSIEIVMQKYLFNIGKSGMFGGKYLLNVLREKQENRRL